MGHHAARVTWELGNGDFLRKRYSRAHQWSFDGGLSVRASASPHIVSAPYSDPTGIDPEEAFVASLSSCHMLCFLARAAQAGFVAEAYEDDAEGTLEKNAEGRLSITRVTLSPAVRFSGEKLPSSEELEHLHHLAHEDCFIANSVKTEIVCTPRIRPERQAA
jgi:organic hydroperoxide reductase OsmC/OhrA